MIMVGQTSQIFSDIVSIIVSNFDQPQRSTDVVEQQLIAAHQVAVQLVAVHSNCANRHSCITANYSRNAFFLWIQNCAAHLRNRKHIARIKYIYKRNKS
jgi:hypothetical protein